MFGSLCSITERIVRARLEWILPHSPRSELMMMKRWLGVRSSLIISAFSNSAVEDGEREDKERGERRKTMKNL